MKPAQTNKKKGRKKKQTESPSSLAVVKEVLTVQREFAYASSFALPRKILESFIKTPGLDPIWSQKRLGEVFGDSLLNLLDSLGPLYGKLAQISLSRWEGDQPAWMKFLLLSRVYGQWPPLAFHEIEAILDEEIPDWHQEFVVEPFPLGVASMAQVHAATDEEGRCWAIKIIKPEAKRRLVETLSALDMLIQAVKPLKLTSIGSRTLREAEDLLSALRRESNLLVEKQNLERMRDRLDSKKQQVLRLPKTYDRFCTESVMVMERFQGYSLVDIVEGRAEIKAEQKKKLAKKILQELLVQVFEIGVFHADPHAGNLILLEDGTVGLFDWGLTGELSEIDRRHISGILKALLMSDSQRLIDVIVSIGDEQGQSLQRSEVEQELRRVAHIMEAHRKASTSAPLDELLEAALKSSENLGVEVPQGLLMMAKSLLTIEGLARGIDPEISFARAAGPVLLKAAKPNLRDALSMGKAFPRLVKKMMVYAS